jgi:hypothetical protein
LAGAFLRLNAPGLDALEHGDEVLLAIQQIKGNEGQGLRVRSIVEVGYDGLGGLVKGGASGERRGWPSI